MKSLPNEENLIFIKYIFLMNINRRPFFSTKNFFIDKYLLD